MVISLPRGSKKLPQETPDHTFRISVLLNPVRGLRRGRFSGQENAEGVLTHHLREVPASTVIVRGTHRLHRPTANDRRIQLSLLHRSIAKSLQLGRQKLPNLHIDVALGQHTFPHTVDFHSGIARLRLPVEPVWDGSVQILKP